MERLEKRQYYAFELLVLLFIGILLYGRTINYGFIWDDKQLIIDNPYFHQKLHILDLFRRSMWSFANMVFDVPYYRPLLTTTYWIENQIWGNIPAFYHMMNIFFHLTSLCLIWILAFKFELSRTGRWLACILFSIHPVQVPTVSVIACQGDLVVQVLTLLALILWMNDTKVRWLALVCVLPAMLFKEAAVVLPIILMAYDFFVRKKNWKKIIFWSPVVTWMIYFSLRRYGLQNVYPVHSEIDSSLLGMGAFRTFEYFTRILFPIPSPLNLVIPKVQFWVALYILIFLITLVVFVFEKAEKAKTKFLWVWFLANFIVIGDLSGHNLRFSDQLLYISMAPFGLLIGMIQIRSNKLKVCGGVLLLMLALISNSQIKIWKNDLEFLKNEMSFNPNDPNIVLSYVVEYIAEKKPEKPCELYSQVSDVLKYNYDEGADYLLNFNLGNCYLETDPARAETYFRMATKISSAQWNVKNNLAVALIRQKKYEEALQVVKETTQEAPFLVLPWRNLGYLLALLDRYAEAIEALQTAQKIDPDNMEIIKMIEEVSILRKQTQEMKSR